MTIRSMACNRVAPSTSADSSSSRGSVSKKPRSRNVLNASCVAVYTSTIPGRLFSSLRFFARMNCGIIIIVVGTIIIATGFKTFVQKGIQIRAAEVPRLEEKLSLLATIAQLAPLIGLLGTVLGFIQTFSRMQEAGLNAHVGQLSAGIWQALVCAAAGLAVAIPAVLIISGEVGAS